MLSATDSNIHISKDHNSLLNQIIQEGNYSNTLVIVDENTHQHCLPQLNLSAPPAALVQIKSGEIHKNLDTCQIIWDEMTNARLDRKALVINLGGGVIGDMGGFCAATYKRGIDFVQMPTTLLSQVDASVGGKLGIDFQGYKNHIGAFRTPKSVIINTDFLQTLDLRELRSGYAEVIKHALISDSFKWEEIKNKSLTDHDWDSIVEHSVKIKSAIAEEDPFEAGLRKILNFGHTIGHAVETYYLDKGDKRLLHGEAIAIGMIAEAHISVKRGFIQENEALEIKNSIQNIFSHQPVAEEDFEMIIPITLQDKKNSGSTIRASLLESVGKANFDIEINEADIREGLIYNNA